MPALELLPLQTEQSEIVTLLQRAGVLIGVEEGEDTQEALVSLAEGVSNSDEPPNGFNAVRLRPELSELGQDGGIAAYYYPSRITFSSP